MKLKKTGVFYSVSKIHSLEAHKESHLSKEKEATPLITPRRHSHTEPAEAEIAESGILLYAFFKFT